MIKAWKNGSFTTFTEFDWKTGGPQRAGWVPESEEQQEKIVPAKILDFVDMRNSKDEESYKVDTSDDVKTDNEFSDADDNKMPETAAEWRELLDELDIPHKKHFGAEKLKMIFDDYTK